VCGAVAFLCLLLSNWNYQRVGAQSSPVTNQAISSTILGGGTLQFSSPTYSVAENGVSATITVTRTGGSSGATSVEYFAFAGTATAGSDFIATSGTFSFADSETSKTFSV
jgi:hypothetical protein